MIKRCPLCGYCLRGLPTVHPCPECGLECDATAVVFGEPRLAWACIAVLAGGVLLWRAVSAFTGTGRPWDWLALAPLLVIVAALIFWLTRQRKLVVLSARCLQILGRSPTPEIFAIENIGGAHWSFVTGTIRISDRQGGAITTISTEFLGAPWRSLKIVIQLKKILRSERL